MKLNLEKYLEQEIKVINNLLIKTNDWKQFDESAFESTRKFGGREIFLVLYPELLTYTYIWYEGAGVYDDGRNRRSELVITPWIACRTELEGEQDTKWHYDVLNELRDWVYEKLPIKPFKDEDAQHQIYARQCSAYIRDWTKYVFYLNIDYPNGWWENHTLK
jgi:hypothetical protein